MVLRRGRREGGFQKILNKAEAHPLVEYDPFRVSFNVNVYRANGRQGLGSQTAADTPFTPGEPQKTPQKQTLGTVTKSNDMLTLQALSSSLNSGTAKRGCLGRGKAVGDLQQSVPQTGRVHVQILE